MGALNALVIYSSPYSIFAINSCIHQYYCFDPVFDQNHYLVSLFVALYTQYLARCNQLQNYNADLLRKDVIYCSLPGAGETASLALVRITSAA